MDRKRRYSSPVFWDTHLSDKLENETNAIARQAMSELQSFLANARCEITARHIGDSEKLLILSSINRISSIVSVISETLSFQTGALIWVCLCSAIKVLSVNFASHGPLIPSLIGTRISTKY